MTYKNIATTSLLSLCALLFVGCQWLPNQEAEVGENMQRDSIMEKGQSAPTARRNEQPIARDNGNPVERFENELEQNVGNANELPTGVPDSLPQGVVQTPPDPEITAMAKECTDGGGLFNSGLKQCFKDRAAEKKATGEDDEIYLEILPGDTEEEIAWKTCVNDGGTYNIEQKQCFERGEEN